MSLCSIHLFCIGWENGAKNGMSKNQLQGNHVQNGLPGLLHCKLWVEMSILAYSSCFVLKSVLTYISSTSIYKTYKSGAVWEKRFGLFFLLTDLKNMQDPICDLQWYNPAKIL